MISKHQAEHYVWGAACDGWHLVKQSEISVIQESMPPGTQEVRHSHRRSRQFFFVLSGEATFEVDGRKETIGRHEGLEIPPGVTHQIFNASASSLEFLVISTPPSHGDRVETDDASLHSAGGSR